MTLLFAESCDETSVGFGWSSVTSSSSINSVADRYGDSVPAGGAWSHSVGTPPTFQYNFPTADEHATVIVGMALKIQSTASLNQYIGIYSFLFPGGTSANARATLWAKCINTNSTTCILEVRSGVTSGGTLLAGTSIAVIDSPAFASWYYIEVKYTTHTSTGAVTINVNEHQVASGTGLDTTGGQAGTTLGGIYIAMSEGSADASVFAMDDIVIMNGAGSVNNDFIGAARVYRVRPTGAGSNTEWTPGGGSHNASNWENVNDVNGIATAYNAEGTDEGTDYYAMGNLPGSMASTIYGVVQRDGLWCNTLNVGGAILVKDSTTEFEHAEVALGTATPAIGTPSVGMVVSIDETKPSGGAWTDTEVNAMQCGVRVKSIT